MAASLDTDSTTRSAAIAPRPPTPPRETSREPQVLVKSVLGRPGQPDLCSSLQTPPPNASRPNSAAIDSNPKSRTKRVEWSAHTEYQEHGNIYSIERLIKSSPISALSPRPIKGILKPSSSLNLSASVPDLDGSTGQLTIFEMLDSTIKQLAGSDRESRLDAYMMLSRALKASNNLPDRVALQDKMSLLMQFIERDIISRNEIGNPDISLINHALTLLATFLHFPAIASTLTSDFGSFIVDYSIRAFEHASTPKDVLRHLMQVVAFQNFSAKVMTFDRVGRLVNALHQIEDHATGKSIVMSRIHIYKRLVKQSRCHMAFCLSWLEDVFMDMLSPFEQIRTQAINLATEAGFALRSEKQLIRRASEIFQTGDEDAVYIESYIHRLQEMLRDKKTSAAVPQIWSAMILYMRCPLERWQYYGPWLTLVQTAFNTADGLTKQEANYAWNRYVFLALDDSSISPKAMGMLCQPLSSQLRRKANPKHPDEASKLRNTVLAGICNIYYYALAPDNLKHPPDIVWDMAVQPLMTQLIGLDGKPEIPGDCLTQAARVLSGLLDAATPRIWRRERIQEMPPVGPEELPAIDTKWTRRNCDKVMRVVWPILEKNFIDLSNRESVIFRLWQALVGSVATASAKDIKVSNETANFFSRTLEFLSKIWASAEAGDDERWSLAFALSVTNFIGVLVDALGVLPFTEKRFAISVTSKADSSATSHLSDRTSKSEIIVDTALHHLFLLLCSNPAVTIDDAALTQIFHSVFDPFFNGRAFGGRVELARELMQLLPRDSILPSGPWILIAQNLFLVLEANGDDGLVFETAEVNKMLGPSYRDIVSLLGRGLTSHPSLDTDHWFMWFDRLSTHVVKEYGDAGRSIVVVEPLARVLSDLYSVRSERTGPTLLRATEALFKIAKFPHDRSSLDIVRKRLWGTTITGAKGCASDVFEHLYKFGNHVLELFYNRASEIDPKDITPTIEALENFLVRSFLPCGVKTLSKLQQGLCLWIRDEKSVLKLDDKAPLSEAISLVWDRLCSRLASHSRLDRGDIDMIEPLLTAAFQSQHPGIARRAVEMWNILAKDKDGLECSDSLKSVVSSLGSTDELVAGQRTGGGQFGAQAPRMVRPSGDSAGLVILSSASSQEDVRPLMSSCASDATGTLNFLTRKRPWEATPDKAHGKPAKRAATPRPRHDDSQIHFAPIVSSPVADGASRHLSEHQGEVRERQLENAAPFSDQPDTSPIRLLEGSRRQTKESTSQEYLQRDDKTPRHSPSYENHVSSTPTPRRGQLLQMDDADPPSSPPVPRPYPLLSEIRSRSSERSFMDSWKFSSPPATPTIEQQQQQQQQQNQRLQRQQSPVPPPSPQEKLQQPPPVDPEPPTETSDNARDAGQAVVKPRRGRPPKSSQKESTAIKPSRTTSTERPADVEVTDAKAIPSETSARSLKMPPLENAPQTPQKRHGPAARTEESPKSADEEFVDARSSPDIPYCPFEAANIGNDSIDTSFALSELDDSCMLKLITELNGEEEKSEDSLCKKPQEKPEDQRSQARRERTGPASPIAGVCPQTFDQVASPSVVPHTPVAVERTETTVKKRPGRKRRLSESTCNDSQGKKRRNDDEVEEVIEPKSTSGRAKTQQQSNSPVLRRSTRKPGSVSSVETRGSARRRLQQREVAKVPLKGLGKPKQKQPSEGPDDEAMSQVGTESIAITQNEQEGQGASPTDDSNADLVTNERNTTAADEADAETEAKAEPKKREPHDTAKDMSLMDMLQDGLERLRNASLSRDEVYKMEDMLMDMKRELFAAEKRGREVKDH